MIIFLLLPTMAILKRGSKEGGGGLMESPPTLTLNYTPRINTGLTGLDRV